MKKTVKRTVLTVFALFVGTAGAWAMDGKEIMTKADERYTGDSGRQTLIMELISKRGKVRKRKILSYFKDYGDSEKTVMAFLEPSDVKGVGYLAWGYDEIGKDDDTWLYLPALKKSRRISGSSRNDDFMGSDFTYDDMGDREVEEDTHTLKGEETLDGQKCWVVESVPKEKDSAYSRKVVRIRQDNFMVVFVEYFDRQNRLQKVLHLEDIKKIDDIWTAGTMTMENVQNKHKTILRFEDIAYNIPVKDNFFTVATLERGRLR